jgi:transcriptional regulator with XRE-family HTH domain
LTFSEIFNDLLKEKGLNRRQFAEMSGIPYTTVIGWTNLKRLPDYVALTKIADFFECSVDYLTGRQDELGYVPCAFELTEEEQVVLQDYRKLNSEDKSLVHTVLLRLCER